jgi:diguanylate cyclase (GGDEF)-like protein/PAS domain S-box-containing protein
MKKYLALIILILLCNYTIIQGEMNEQNINLDINEHGSVMLIINYESGQIVMANQAAVEFYGYSLDELTGMTIDNINTLSTSEVQYEMALAKTEQRQYFCFKHQLKSGEIREVDVYSSPVTIDGEIYLFSIIHDVSDRVAAKESLKNNQLIVLGLMGVFIISIIIYLLRQRRLKASLRSINNRYDSLFSNMKEGVALHEIILNEEGVPIDYKFLEINRAFEEITGLKGENIIDKSVKTVMPQTEQYWIEKYGEVVRTGNTISFENYSQEIEKYFKVNVYRFSSKEFVTVFADITEEKRMNGLIEKDRALFKTTLHSLGDAVISSDLNGNVELMNAVAEVITGWTLEEAKGKPFCDVFNIINEFSKIVVPCPVQYVLETGEPIELEHNTLLINKNGEEIAIEDSAAPIMNDNGDILGAVVVFRDYTEKKERIGRITYLSYHDQLTGLYNRRFFEEEITRLDKKDILPVALLMIDVNGLKLTNDAFGHIMGDQLLVKVAEVLKNTCRKDDAISRIGGDEFVILLPNTKKDVSEKLVKRIYAEIEKCTLNGIIISVSIGWETKESHHVSMSEIFRKAEEHMYRKKLTESQSMRNSTIKVILKTLNESNKREKIHSEQVSKLVVKIGRALAFNNEDLKELEIAGLMHDIGKIAVNNIILNKKGALTDQEYEEIKKHPEIGYHILKSVDEYSELAEYALSHHERWDGKGYPRGLKGEEIPLFARIITVADSFEAMTADRPYRKGISQEEALKELERCSGTQFDPHIVEVFVKAMR